MGSRKRSQRSELLLITIDRVQDRSSLVIIQGGIGDPLSAFQGINRQGVLLVHHGGDGTMEKGAPDTCARQNL